MPPSPLTNKVWQCEKLREKNKNLYNFHKMWNGSNKSTKRQTHKKTQFPQIHSYLIWMYLKTLFGHYVSNEPEGRESFNLACCNVRGKTGFLTLLLYVSAWLKSQTLCFNASNSTSFQITPLFVWYQMVTDFHFFFLCDWKVRHI